MKLSTKESEILACVELRAEMSIEAVRKETGHRDHAIRYALARLEARGVVRKMPFINLGALGYTMHNVFFSLNSKSSKLEKQLIDHLFKTKEVTWVAELGGDYQYGIDICARNILDVRRVLDGIAAKFGNIFFQKTISSQYAATALPRRYLSARKHKVSPLTISYPGYTVEIDDHDDKILRALSAQGSESHRTLAAGLGMPLSTFELRVRKLKEKGVITGHYYAINPGTYDYSHYKIIVYSKGVNPKVRDALFQFANRHPNVISIYECLGSWDFELGVEVEKPQLVVRVAQEICDAVGDELNTVKILTKFRDLKWVGYP